MKVLIDTNILLRINQPAYGQNQAAVGAIPKLELRGDFLCVVPQVLYEFWVVATRPTAVNGLGFPISFVSKEMARFQSIFGVLHDSPSIFNEWQNLVTTYKVVGKNAHDARLVAAMIVHGISHLLTFNTQDFARYPMISVLDPATV